MSQPILPLLGCLLLALPLSAQAGKGVTTEVEVRSEKSRRNVEDGEKAGASRSSGHTWGSDGSENYKFRRATDNYYEVTEDVTRSEPTASGFSRVTRTRVYFREPGTGDYMRYETWVYYDAQGEVAVVKGSTEGNMKLWTRFREERDKGEKQLDEDRRKLDDATAGGDQTGGGAGDLGGAGSGADQGADPGTGGSAVEKGARAAAKVLVERWGERARFERLIQDILRRFIDGGRMGKPEMVASAWANLPGKRAQALAMASREATRDKGIYRFGPLEWDEAGRVEIEAWATLVGDDESRSCHLHALIIPYLGEWGLWTFHATVEE